MTQVTENTAISSLTSLFMTNLIKQLEEKQAKQTNNPIESQK